jgi:hypothetical protein
MDAPATSLRSHELAIDSVSRDLAIANRVDDLAAIAQTITSGEQPRHAGRARGRVDDDAPLVVRELRDGLEQIK